MPEIVERYYRLSGLAKVLIYSQSEMAESMGITEAELVRHLENYTDVRGLGWHAHPKATGGGYEFNQVAFDDNLRVWQCHQSGGHNFVRDDYYDYLPRGAFTCDKCDYTRFP